MCLGVPGKIIELYSQGELRMCKVDFGGVIRDACVEALPDEAKIGDWTIIHAGFALSLLDEEQAMESIRLLEEMASYDDELAVQSD